MVPAFGQQVEDKYVILFDQSHGQYFTPEMLKTAFDSLNALETYFNIKIEVKTINSKFNLTNLQGADLLIITNPDSGSTTSTEEKRALADFIRAGGSTLYLGNPYSDDKNITGNPQLINDLMDSSFQPRTSFQPAKDTLDKPTVVVDDFNNDGNITHVVLTNDTLNFDAMHKGPNPGFTNVSKILYYGTPIVDKDSVSSLYKRIVYGNFSHTTYAVDEKFETAVLSQTFYWLVGKEYKQGRTMAIGSTIMFSDLPYDENSKWIDQMDNLKLFQNVIAWLLQLTPLDPETPIVEKDFGFFVALNLSISVGFALLVAIVAFASLILSGKLSPSDVTKFKREQPKLQKEVKQTKLASSGKQTKITKKKKKKRGQVK